MKKNIIYLLLLFLVFAFSSCDNTNGDDNVKMIAQIDNVAEHIEVTVLESKYTFGPYWVITDFRTIFLDGDGNRIQRNDLKNNDKIEIYYNGQVMLSYPPQIVATKIKIVE